ncbi:MAG: SUF system NifU family Fe-S cluster assembly protein [Francisellaceae bacterium]|jgi:nitrogen fixation protein NifU and related proteins|nr:SUF system NifU family Fe-S cluster assembly protein [Francisellaceae bacterium]MBT6207984.1 SUF system NifU family Fe-S cluster assembly protein [Francisellaceae bacterium]MBT6538065.1 SUF system NifU family Fe-S cluster assembly protein [Francisellaceae bacterium]
MIEDLYQELIIDHGTQPRNFKVMDDCSCNANGHNPLCGDKITVYLKLNNSQISDVSFAGEGCAISMASASIMSGEIKQQSTQKALTLLQEFTDCLTKDLDDKNLPIKLQALIGVKQYPMRVKCATLAWHTFKAALQNDKDIASTE